MSTNCKITVAGDSVVWEISIVHDFIKFNTQESIIVSLQFSCGLNAVMTGSGLINRLCKMCVFVLIRETFLDCSSLNLRNSLCRASCAFSNICPIGSKKYFITSGPWNNVICIVAGIEYQLYTYWIAISSRSSINSTT